MKTRTVRHVTLGDFIEFLARTYNVDSKFLHSPLQRLMSSLMGHMAFRVKVEPYPYEVGSAKGEILNLCGGGDFDLHVVLNDLCANGLLAPGDYMLDQY